MGSYKWGYRGFVKGSFMGSFRGSIGFIGFRGSYAWGYKAPDLGYKHSYPTYNPTCNCP